jgi:hypothetical protein
MATVTKKQAKPLPAHLQAALDDGYLTQEHLRELIAIQAELLGLDFDEAVERAKSDTLPRNIIGADLRLLVSVLST